MSTTNRKPDPRAERSKQAILNATRELVNEALDLVRAQHCEVEALVPTTSTLEEVFVRTVEK